MTKILLIVFHLILLNVDLISLKNNSEPAANAIKPNDTSNMKSISLIMVSLIIPKKFGPIITPTTINPVTSGKPNFLRYELR